MNFKGSTPEFHTTIPYFEGDASRLAVRMRDYSAEELVEALGISNTLAARTYQQYQQFDTPEAPRREAVFAYCGLVFSALIGEEPDPNMIRYAQDHLRILSGLYGILRPLDLIQPYRLDVGDPIDSPDDNSLYEFWRDRVTAQLAQEGLGEALINLASDEYFRMVVKSLLPADLPVITPVFKEQRGSAYKVIVTDTKKARGTMSRYILKNRITDPQQLKQYQEDGYVFFPDLSSETEWVFVR